jgi:hypothetical protein
MRLLFACLLLAACDDAGARVDDCSGLIGERCVTFHLVAEPELTDSTLDTVVMWVGYQTNGFHNVRLQTQMHAPTNFPVAVGLRLPQALLGPAEVRIEALIGPGPLAYRFVTVEPALGEHVEQDVVMQKYQTSGCFDGKFTSSMVETDVDCGNTCPPCASGQRCTSGLDCLSTVCSSVCN